MSKNNQKHGRVRLIMQPYSKVIDQQRRSKTSIAAAKTQTLSLITGNIIITMSWSGLSQRILRLVGRNKQEKGPEDTGTAFSQLLYFMTFFSKLLQIKQCS